MTRKPLWVATLVVLCGFLALSCSRSPSEKAIKTAITELLKQEVPMSWSGSMMGGENAQIELIEIQQIGKFNRQGQYWPVKARVKGSCQANFIFSTETRAFDRVGDFQVRQDDYGNWKASLEMMQ